jgi:imidazolonepropionase-like amidohydrolase
LAAIFSLSAPPASAQNSAVTAIVGGQLIDGNEGPPLHESVVLIQGKKITAVGREGEIQIPAGAKIIDAHGMTVMPGLIDMHVHLDLIGAGNFGTWFPYMQDSRERARQVMKISLHEIFMGGVTTIRDMGGPTDDLLALRDAVNSGKETGPRMFVTGAYISRICGNPAWKQALLNCSLVHSTEEAREEAKKRIAAGTDWVKAWIGLTAEDEKAIAEEAHKAGKKVGAHGTTDAEIRAGLAAPVDSLEHVGSSDWGSVSPELIHALAQSDIWISPTMISSYRFKLADGFPEGVDSQQLKADLPPDLYRFVHDSVSDPDRLRRGIFSDIPQRLRVNPESWRELLRSGVAGHIVLGTDSGTPMNWHFDSARNKMKLFVQFGMTPLQAISAGTRLPAVALGKGDEFGTIEPGKSADILVIDGNPLEDMADLKNLVHIFKEGTQYK